MRYLPTMPRPLPTTGRIATRMPPEEQAALHAALQPFLATPEYLANPPQPLEVEIGIGNGLALYARAKANPSQHFLGSEIYLNGLRTLVKELQKCPLSNLHIYPHDGRSLFSPQVAAELPVIAAASPQNRGVLPHSAASRLLVLFPDPWPKSSHRKRRLIQPQMLEDAAKIISPGGEFWVVTDWPDYAHHTIAHIYQSKSLKLAPENLLASDCKPSARLEQTVGPQLLSMQPTWWQPTKYQQKAALAGRNPWFIKAIKVA